MTQKPIASSLTFSENDRQELLKVQPAISAEIQILAKDCALLEAYYLINKSEDEIKVGALINMLYEVQNLCRKLSEHVSPLTVARKLINEDYIDMQDINVESLQRNIYSKLLFIKGNDFKIKVLGGYYDINKAIQYCEVLCK